MALILETSHTLGAIDKIRSELKKFVEIVKYTSVVFFAVFYIVKSIEKIMF